MRSILILEDHKREIKEKYIDIIEQKKKQTQKGTIYCTIREKFLIETHSGMTSTPYQMEQH